MSAEIKRKGSATRLGHLPDLDDNLIRVFYDFRRDG
jgi:hypothetical protein